MNPIWVVVLVAGSLLSGLALGLILERRQWVARAMPPSETPHHCDGQFYYVIEEGYFVREYVRRDPFPMLPNEGQK